MKNINFFVAKDPKKIATFSQWYRITIMLSVGIILMITIFELRYIMHAFYYRKQTAIFKKFNSEFNKVMERKQNLKKEELALQQKISHIKQYSKQNPSIYISALAKIEGFHLELFAVHENNVEMKGWVAAMSTTNKLMQTLSTVPFFKSLKLNSIQPYHHGTKNGFEISLTGLLNV